MFIPADDTGFRAQHCAAVRVPRARIVPDLSAADTADRAEGSDLSA